MSVKKIFDDAAVVYDRHRKKVIPCFDDFYETLVRLIPYHRDDSFAVLDLGAGTGLVTALVLNAFPNARATLVDISNHMMEKALKRFRENPNVTLQVMDYAKSPFPGEFHLIVSAMSVHHLEDSGKEDLFRKIFEALLPGGWFIHAELVRGASEFSENLFQQNWQNHLAQTNLAPEELSAIAQRMSYDKPALLSDQLGWLKAAGFRDVDCFYKYYNFAVYAGRKANKVQ